MTIVRLVMGGDWLSPMQRSMDSTGVDQLLSLNYKPGARYIYLLIILIG